MAMSTAGQASQVCGQEHCCSNPPHVAPAQRSHPAPHSFQATAPAALPRRPTGAPPPNVLVPGCGLGRLCVEVAQLGMACQGCEHSFYMLLAASFVLNHLLEPEQLTIHPWLHSSSNHLRDADQLRGLAVPDQAAADMMAAPGLLSMVAGDFVVRALARCCLRCQACGAALLCCCGAAACECSC